MRTIEIERKGVTRSKMEAVLQKMLHSLVAFRKRITLHVVWLQLIQECQINLFDVYVKVP